MGNSRLIERKVEQIEILHEGLKLGSVTEDAMPSTSIDTLFEDKVVLSCLERAKRRVNPKAHEIRISILKAFLSQVDQYGFLKSDVAYVDWCSGRGEVAYAINYLTGAFVVRVDKNFPRKNIIEEYFSCTKEANVISVPFDLTTLKYDGKVPQIPENSNGKVAYLGTYCCGSLPDLVIKYAELQRRKPDFIAVIPCHHEEWDFELSTLAANLKVSEYIFKFLTRTVADLQNSNGYHDAARKSMEIIDHYRAENLKLVGYDAKVVRLYQPNVSPFNHLIIGVRE